MVRRVHSEVLIGEKELLRGVVLVSDVELHRLPCARSVFNDRVGRRPGHDVDPLVSGSARAAARP